MAISFTAKVCTSVNRRVKRDLTEFLVPRFSCQNRPDTAINRVMTDTHPVRRTSDDSIPTRASLLQRLQGLEGEQGWQEFFEIYWPFIYRSAVSCGLRDADAQDVAQQTLVAVWKGLPKFKYDPERAAFRTWLIGILRCRIADHHRKNARRPAVATPEDGTGTAPLERLPDPGSAAPEPSTDAEWEENLLRAARERVWKRMSQRDVQIYEHYERLNRKAGATARDLHVTTAHVYVARYRVEKELKKELARLRKEIY